MIRRYRLHLPIDADACFELLSESGAEIVSWRATNLDQEHRYIEWKQSFWSLTGTTMIAATVTETAGDLTTVEVIVHKPLQVFDPVGLCDKVFAKLKRAVDGGLRARSLGESQVA